VEHLDQSAVVLADACEGNAVSAMIVHGDGLPSVFARGDVSGMLAMALDSHPELIQSFINALTVVRLWGENRDHPAFAAVIFAKEREKHSS
jgi:hypothetical protein